MSFAWSAFMLHKLLFLLSLLFLTGCALFTAPLRATVQPSVATLAVPTAVGQSADSSLPANFSGIVQPSRDPDIVALMNNVSEQQLIAYVQQLQEFYTRNSFSDTQREDRGIGAARNWIYREFERVGGGRLQLRFEDFPLTFEGVSSTQRNVVATLPGIGNHPGSIVVGAHYDSRVGSATDGTTYSPSANDNGSGIALLLELARLLSSRSWNQTIIFVAFSAEEQNTAGSRYFVTNSILSGVQIDLMLNNDAVGGRAGIPRTVRAFAPDIATSPSGRTLRYVQLLNTIYQPEFPLEVFNALDRQGRYGDQREFINAGIGAIRFVESQENPELLNSSRDTWDRLDYSYLTEVIKVNLVTLANWAGSPPPPAAPIVNASAESGSYQLIWTPDPQTASYAISFRPLDSLTFPEFRYVGGRDAGNQVISGLDPNITYAVSIAPIGISGRLGGFSPEVIVP